MNTSVATAQPQSRSGSTVVGILAMISVSHLLNDTLQSLIPSIYPLLKSSLQLNFSQIGLITLTLQLTASLLQPLVGMYTVRRPMPYSLAAGLMGVGSSIFHPESSRIARMSSGGRHGLAQSVFHVGANTGSSLGPLL